MIFKNDLPLFVYCRGWGLRCLDDIPKGGFICIYAGQLLTDQGANEDGQQYGDEYLAELDYIEVCVHTYFIQIFEIVQVVELLMLSVHLFSCHNFFFSPWALHTYCPVPPCQNS